MSIVSVPAPSSTGCAAGTRRSTPRAGLFTLDLAVLADGRLAVLIKDGDAVAVAPREMRALLREAGWTGEDLLLLAAAAGRDLGGTRTHLGSLVDHAHRGHLAAGGGGTGVDPAGRPDRRVRRRRR